MTKKNKVDGKVEEKVEHGRVKGGVIVLDNPNAFPDGTEVIFEVIEEPPVKKKSAVKGTKPRTRKQGKRK